MARHSLTHCEHFECKQVGGNQVCYKFSRPENFAGAQIFSSDQVLTRMGWGVQRGCGVFGKTEHPHSFRAGGKIRSGPKVGKVATSPLPSRGSPAMRSGGQDQKWPTSGQGGYATPAVLGIPTGSERGGGGGGIRSSPQVGKMATSPAVSGIPTASERGGGRNGPLVGKVATSPLPSRGSPQLQSGGENQKWPTSGQSGHVTPAVSGIPSDAQRGARSEVAHKWARWLRHPCRVGDPHRFRAGGGGGIRSYPQVGKMATSPAVSGIPTASERGGGGGRNGPQVGKEATSPLLPRGSPPLQSGGKNQKWPISGQSGYVTPAVSGILTASERGENQKWPTCGQSGYVTPATSGIPTASERGGKSEVAHKWAK